MKIIFFGSSDFAVPALEALADKEEVLLAVTQPDRKKGRSLKLARTPVKKRAKELGIKVFQPESANHPDSIAYFRGFEAGLFIVVSFGQILAGNVLAIPKRFSLNVHASLLPKYRGAAPINWAIARGEKETGVSIIKMSERMDAGEVVLKAGLPIGEHEDAIALSERLSKKGAGLLLDAIDLIKRDSVTFTSQDDSQASYAPKLKKQDGLIDWSCEGREIYDRIRAFVPWPGCFTYWGKKGLKLWKAGSEGGRGEAKPGTVLEAGKSGIVVGAGKGAIRIEELQLEGKRRMTSGEFLAGHRDMKPGTNLTLQSRTKVSS